MGSKFVHAATTAVFLPLCFKSSEFLKDINPLKKEKYIPCNLNHLLKICSSNNKAVDSFRRFASAWK
jgi:hypothetical protein